MNTDATIKVHVTRIDGDDVHGHTVDHCDPAGCNGTERFWPELRGEECERGGVAEFGFARPPRHKVATCPYGRPHRSGPCSACTDS
jgi:hypothetical protein